MRRLVPATSVPHPHSGIKKKKKKKNKNFSIFIFLQFPPHYPIHPTLPAGIVYLIQSLAIRNRIRILAPLDVEEQQRFVEVGIAAAAQESDDVALFIRIQRQRQQIGHLAHFPASAQHVRHQLSGMAPVALAPDKRQRLADQSVGHQHRQLQLDVFQLSTPSGASGTSGASGGTSRRPEEAQCGVFEGVAAPVLVEEGAEDGPLLAGSDVGRMDERIQQRCQRVVKMAVIQVPKGLRQFDDARFQRVGRRKSHQML